MILYSNSCSFGAPNQGHPVYPDVVAKNLNLDCVLNRGKPGSCNRRIIRTSIRDLIELQKTVDSEIVALIGLTFVSRTELWQPSQPAVDNDGHFQSVTVDDKKINWGINGLIDTIVPDISNYVDEEVREYYKQWLIHFNPESVVTDLLTDLIMFVSYLEHTNIKYIIFSNVDVLPGDNKVGYNSPFIQSLKETVHKNKNIIDLWSFSFGGFALSKGLLPRDYTLYKQHGHPGEQAHNLFGDYLSDILITNFNNLSRQK
jgi:hypothetical protein